MSFRGAALVAGVLGIGVVGVPSRSGATVEAQDLKAQEPLSALEMPKVAEPKLTAAEALIGKHNLESRIRAAAAQIENNFLPNALLAIDRTNAQDPNWSSWNKQHQNGSTAYSFASPYIAKRELQAASQNTDPTKITDLLGIIPHSTPGYWSKAWIEQLTEIEKAYQKRERFLHPENPSDMEPNYFGEQFSKFATDKSFDLGLSDGPEVALEFISKAKEHYNNCERIRAEREAQELAYRNRNATTEAKPGLDVVGLYEVGKEIYDAVSTSGKGQTKP